MYFNGQNVKFIADFTYTPEEAAIYFYLEPTMQLTGDALSKFYEPSFYTSLPLAVADLNAGITDNTDATVENALCAVYTDYDGNTCLILLTDVDLSESITISATCIFKVNGYTINYPGDYSIYFEGSDCVFDLRVDGSKLVKNVANVSTNLGLATFIGNNSLLIGGSISYIAESHSKAIAAIVSRQKDKTNPKPQNLIIKNCDIYVKAKNGSSAVYGVSNAASLEMYNVSVLIEANNSTIYGIRSTSDSSKCIIKECNVNVGSCAASSYGIMVAVSTDWANIIDCNIFADGIHGGEETGDLPGQSIGVMNDKLATVKNCKVFATHCGIQCSNGSTTIIDGGLYEGVGHGGIYFANVNGNFYGQNATFRCVPYRGAYRDQYIYQNTDYLNAAAYVTSNTGLKAYVDNCVFDGNGPCISGTDSAGNPMGGEPIRFRSGGTGNALYASNCTFMGDGKIRFGGGNQHLYLGFGNRVLCESNLPDCVDSTTYKNKVFTSYEEG